MRELPRGVYRFEIAVAGTGDFRRVFVASSREHAWRKFVCLFRQSELQPCRADWIVREM